MEFQFLFKRWNKTEAQYQRKSRKLVNRKNTSIAISKQREASRPAE